MFLLGLGVGVNWEVASRPTAMAQKARDPQKYINIFLCSPGLLDRVLPVKRGWSFVEGDAKKGHSLRWGWLVVRNTYRCEKIGTLDTGWKMEGPIEAVLFVCPCQSRSIDADENARRMVSLAACTPQPGAGRPVCNPVQLPETRNPQGA